MDRIEKEIRKLSERERGWVKEIFKLLRRGKTASLDIKKLKGREDIFRVRKGDIRIIYRLTSRKEIFVLSIEKRKERTYK